ncbi:hypothetical protein ACN47E_008402 [Coniothyrium glycines]
MWSLPNSIRKSTFARLSTAILASSLITSATLLSILLPGVNSSPLPQPLTDPRPAPVPQPHTLPGPQAHSPPPTSGEYPDPEPCHGHCTYVLDPSILYDEGLYWRFSTSKNIQVASAPSLEGPWTYKGSLLPQGTSIKLYDNQDIWAPTVTKLDGLYYCHYAVSEMFAHNSKIGLATSKSLEPGTWTDHGEINIPFSEHWNAIDPYVFRESPESPMYFTFGSHWNGIHQFELQSHAELAAFAGPVDRITNIARNTTSNMDVMEGATMFKHADFYYLFFSAGVCCNTEKDGLAPIERVYRVAVCRAGTATGPFRDAKGRDCLNDNGGTVILASHGEIYAPGGQDITVHPDSGRTMISYHYIRTSVGYDNEQKFYGFNYLEWSGDGWPVLVHA